MTDELQIVLTAISTVGFPIVCCIAMAFYVKYITDKNREEIAVMNDKHMEEVRQMTDALNNNTLAIQRLCDKIK